MKTHDNLIVYSYCSSARRPNTRSSARRVSYFSCGIFMLRRQEAHADRLLCPHRPAPPSLAACANLAPAGTASTTIFEMLLAAGSRLAHHRHSIRARHLQRQNNGVAPPCLVMSLRDPAQRLRSGFAWEFQAHSLRECRRMTVDFVCPMLRLAVNASDFVRAFVSPEHPAHSSVVDMHRRSITRPRQVKWGDVDAVVGGSNFLIAQSDYLRSISCASSSVHYVCAENLVADWRKLLPPTIGVSAALYLRRRRANMTVGVDISKKRARALQRLTHLSVEEKELVRTRMFPQDTALWRRECLAR